MGLRPLCGQKGALSAFSGHNKLVSFSLNEKSPFFSKYFPPLCCLCMCVVVLCVVPCARGFFKVGLHH